MCVMVVSFTFAGPFSPVWSSFRYDWTTAPKSSVMPRLGTRGMPKPSGPHGDAGVWSALAVRLSEPDRLVCAMAVREILGREAEVQAVGRFLDGPAPAGLVLEGPAGIGKTTVWRAGIEHARRAGHRVLVTRPSEVETAPAMAADGPAGRGVRSARCIAAGTAAIGARRGAAPRERRSGRRRARGGVGCRAGTGAPRGGGEAGPARHR